MKYTLIFALLLISYFSQCQDNAEFIKYKNPTSNTLDSTDVSMRTNVNREDLIGNYQLVKTKNTVNNVWIITLEIYEDGTCIKKMEERGDNQHIIEKFGKWSLNGSIITITERNIIITKNEEKSSMNELDYQAEITQVTEKGFVWQTLSGNNVEERSIGKPAIFIRIDS